jgi:tRNA A-37 threonylcarbamoyl transferase component Bud32/tetratricopeptide (TPR) repeat protein
MELVGRQFGHLRVTEAIGQGGMGDVYAAWDEKLERKVALKVLNADQRLDEESRGRLLREARSLSKLDHSNICRIHDYIEGTGDDGDVDLLVLEFIDGETLHEALEKGPMSRAEKLRIAIKVAEVLIDAHREGIVHRDLKPDNVMLTKSGEVKVLDFGLARWFRKGASQPRMVAEPPSTPVRELEDNFRLGDTLALDAAWNRRTPTGRREFQGTAIGITLGTPIYMSPEQARGENLTPASDMFSFGLLLQTLFTGKDPHPMDITAREVILRVARGETLPVESAPRDVTTLINRLKRFAPADRPTAVETLERLQFFADKPQRILRRSIAAAVAIVLFVGAWRYVVDLRRERAIAVAERTEAQQRRAQVEDLLEFMLGDLRNKLEPVGRLDILDDVGERALAHVSSLEPEKMNAQELTRNAKALHQLIQVRMSQLKYPEALKLGERALRLTTRAVALPDATPDVKLQHSFSHFWLGRVLVEQREYPKALERMSAYAAMTDELARAHPANDTYVMERAFGHNAVAKILERQGNLAAAIPHYETALSVQQALADAKPDDVDRQTALGSNLNNLGYTLQQAGRLRAARDTFARELALSRKLFGADPENRSLQNRLVLSLSYSAVAAEESGDGVSAIALVEEELRLAEQLHAHDPSNTQWAMNVASAHMHLSWLLRSSDARRARDEAIAAERALQRMLAAEPGSKTLRRRLALSRVIRAEAELTQGSIRDAAGSIDAAEEALAGQQLSDATPADIQRLRGDFLAAAGDLGRASEFWTRAAAAYRPLAEKGKPSHQAAYAAILLRLDRVEAAQPFIARLDAIGYRDPDYVAELKRFRN